MRGAWAAGVLSFLWERGATQFDRVYAASSGACCAAYFVAGMLEPGLEVWREHVGGRKLLRKTNFLRRKPLIDLANSDANRDAATDRNRDPHGNPDPDPDRDTTSD